MTNWWNIFIIVFAFSVPVTLAFAATILLRKEKRQRIPTPTDFKKEAMPIDPNSPPTWKIYRPKKGAPGRSCACHPDRPLRDGQKVLWWPVPISGGGVNVFCEDGVEVDV